ncbi:hypothetical protein HKD37_19G054343 [Glycine soja]
MSTKLRIMCSYNGHIVPCPHDKSLSTCLSKTFLNRRPFTLKYQLLNEDLDSLISVTIDEDLRNMTARPSQIHLFLFPHQT